MDIPQLVQRTAHYSGHRSFFLARCVRRQSHGSLAFFFPPRGSTPRGVVLTKEQLIAFQEAQTLVLLGLLGVQFENLALVEENNLVEMSFTFGHGGRATRRGIKRGREL